MATGKDEFLRISHVNKGKKIVLVGGGQVKHEGSCMLLVFLGGRLFSTVKVVLRIRNSLAQNAILHAGQPKRHLLSTGWSVFVSAKRLVAGDSVLFI